MNALVLVLNRPAPKTVVVKGYRLINSQKNSEQGRGLYKIAIEKPVNYLHTVNSRLCPIWKFWNFQIVVLQSES